MSAVCTVRLRIREDGVEDKRNVGWVEKIIGWGPEREIGIADLDVRRSAVPMSEVNWNVESCA